MIKTVRTASGFTAIRSGCLPFPLYVTGGVPDRTVLRSSSSSTPNLHWHSPEMIAIQRPLRESTLDGSVMERNSSGPGGDYAQVVLVLHCRGGGGGRIFRNGGVLQHASRVIHDPGRGVGLQDGPANHAFSGLHSAPAATEEGSPALRLIRSPVSTLVRNCRRSFRWSCPAISLPAAAAHHPRG